MENEIQFLSNFDSVWCPRFSFKKTAGIKSNYWPSDLNRSYVLMKSTCEWRQSVILKENQNTYISEEKTPKSTKSLNLRGIAGLLKNLSEKQFKWTFWDIGFTSLTGQFLERLLFIVQNWNENPTWQNFWPRDQLNFLKFPWDVKAVLSSK